MMSLREPPPEEESTEDVRPSRRFTVLFTLAIVAIAIGYTWVWHAKTSRVVPEPPPALVLGVIAPAAATADDDVAAVRAALIRSLRSVPRLDLVQSASEVDTTGERYPRQVLGLSGTVERDASERGADEPWQLELRRTNAAFDSLQYIYRVRGSSPAEVAHRMAVQVAMSFGLPLPPDSARD